MRYLDTSLLVPLFIREPISAEVGAWLADIGPAELAVSDWGLTEFSSAASIKTRTRQIDDAMRARVQTDFREFVHSRVRRVLPVLSADFHQAAEFCDRWEIGLRAGDALHLAVAARCGLTVCSLDRTMLEAARVVGVAVESVGGRPR